MRLRISWWSYTQLKTILSTCLDDLVAMLKRSTHDLGNVADFENLKILCTVHMDMLQIIAIKLKRLTDQAISLYRGEGQKSGSESVDFDLEFTQLQEIAGTLDRLERKCALRFRNILNSRRD